MPVLQVERPLNGTAQSVTDATKASSPLSLSTTAVGVGTTTPERALDVVGEFRTYAVDANSKKGVEIAYLGNNRNRILSYDRTANAYLDLFIEAGRGDTGVTITSQGDVGVKTTAPATAFHVNGQSLWLTGGDGAGLNRSLAGKGLRLYFDADGDFAAIFAYDYPGKRPKNLVLNEDTAGANVGIGTRSPREKLEVKGNIMVTGDVKLEGADCAEHFNVDDASTLESGTVMIIGDEERLCQCVRPYDRRVAGVLSGAGGCRPGIVLGTQPCDADRLPLALTGKVYCKVDAAYGAIAIGDLLTTSATQGHAMKAADATRAFGAVLGKALRPVATGTALIPVLVSLQ